MLRLIILVTAATISYFTSLIVCVSMKSTPVDVELFRLVIISRTTFSVTNWMLNEHCLFSMDSRSLERGSLSTTGMDARSFFTLLMK